MKGLREVLTSWDCQRKGFLVGLLGSPLSSQWDGVGEQKPRCQVSGVPSALYWPKSERDAALQFLYLYTTKLVF